MRKRSRLKAFLDGVASIGEGWASNASIWGEPIRRPWRYEEQFGTDEEQLQGDWQSVSDDMMRAIETVSGDIRDAIKDEQGNDQEDPRP